MATDQVPRSPGGIQAGGGSPPSPRHKWIEALLTYLRALLAAALTALLAVFTASGHWPSGGKEWGALAWAVLLATIPVIINALNPNDPRYGRGSAGSQ